MSTMIAVLALLFVPPVIPTPPELEVCVLSAELCVVRQCSADPERQSCVAAYEDCAYDIPEAHVSSCRASYAWCVLEMSPDWLDEALDECAQVMKACPDPMS